MSDHYCTYFDHRYAAQGLAMLRSLRAHGAIGTVWILCLSPQAEKVMSMLAPEGTKLISLAELESHFPDLAGCRADRSLIEFYFTLTPHVVRYVFDKTPDARRVAYLDGDLYFFDSAERVWDHIGEAPAAIIPHNFQPKANRLAKYGNYNVGWVSFARSEQGFLCLEFWRTSCRDWCHDVPSDGRFADQGYLDRFVEFAPDLAVVKHKGCNLGPWNVGRYAILLEDERVKIDEDPLVFFHFTGFKQGPFGYWYNSHRIYRTSTTRVVRDHVYRPYLDALSAIRFEVESALERIPAEPDISVSTTTLTRKRGGGAPIRALAAECLARLYRLMDLVGGSALPTPPAKTD